MPSPRTRPRVGALVFVGDAMEEKVDRLCQLAGELGLKGVPIFMFHEGGDRAAAAASNRWRNCRAAPISASIWRAPIG